MDVNLSPRINEASNRNANKCPEVINKDNSNPVSVTWAATEIDAEGKGNQRSLS